MGLFIVAFFILLASIPTIALVGLLVWTRWVGRRAAAPRFAMWPGYVLLAVGVGVTITGIVGGLQSVVAVHAATSPADRSRLLAAGTAELMWNQGLTALIGIATALWLLFATWRWHWARR